MGEKEMPNLFDGNAKIIFFNDVSGEPTELGTVVNGLSVDTTTDPTEIRYEAEQGENVSHLLPSKYEQRR